MNKFPSFQQFLETSSAQIPTVSFLSNIIFATILAWTLGIFYIRYGRSLSNRNSFSRNFVPLTLITTLIISVIKSSLALSLGLVGALSIVRFRVAIKEPEEIIYLFLCIALGLGFGADQGSITSLALLLFFIVVSIMDFEAKNKVNAENLHLVISSDAPSSNLFDNINMKLNEYCDEVILKRMDDSNDNFEASFFVIFASPDSLKDLRKELMAMDETIKITFFDIDPSL
tara:strand:- start:4370 stop:5056 length:687 start_codon:yes stop_codon:yes gene_type:complete